MPLGRLFGLMTLPARVGTEMMREGATLAARTLDAVTGGDEVNIDSTHRVSGEDPGRWADAFSANPARISPLASGVRDEGNGSKSGAPFPGGPRIGIDITSREDGVTEDGRRFTVLDVRYHKAFEGPGRITVTERREGDGLDVRDEWKGVRNRSFLPSRAAEVGHPLVAGLGFEDIGD